MINESQVIEKLSAVSKSFKEQLKKKGVIVPVKTKKGLNIDGYRVEKNKAGFSIYNSFDIELYSNLYYIQTAVVIANCLALKKAVRPTLVQDDAKAGANEFDMELYQFRLKAALKQKDEFKIGHYQTRATESKLYYTKHINPINSAYFSLVNAIKSTAPNNKY